MKTDIARMLNENAGRFEAVSINPMFAPRVGWNEQCVAMVDLFTGPKSFAFKKFLEAWGARVEETTAREHDPLTSVIQVATHALVLSAGAALLSENLKLDRILNFATPPFKLLLVLMHRLTTQSPEVYWDIQAFHPLGHDMRNQLIAAIGDIQTGVQRQDPTEFLKLLEDLKKLFKDDEDVILEWTKRALTI